MDGLPLHPAIVHLPVGLAFILPLISIVIGFFFYKGWMDKKSFFIIAVLHVALAGFSYVAEETGEDEEHTVERVVSEKHIEEHEEAAETFVTTATIVAIISIGLAFLPHSLILKVALPLILIAQIFLGFQVYEVGHSGGLLVYKHGAASAYEK